MQGLRVVVARIASGLARLIEHRGGEVDGEDVRGARSVRPEAALAADDLFALQRLERRPDGAGAQFGFLGNRLLRRPCLQVLGGVVGQAQQDQLFRGREAPRTESPCHSLNAHPCPPMRFSWARMA